MAKRKNNGSDPVKRALLDELDHVCRGLERVFTRAELAKDPEYALARRLKKWAKDLQPEKPFVLVTVSGGVASVWCPRGIEYDIIDWDDFERDPPTQNDLVQLREIAGYLQDKTDRKFLLGQIQELEDRGRGR